MIVAIDGPAGSGKSAVARRLARRLGFLHLDTGALYRTFTLLALRREVPLADGDAIAALVEGAAVRLEPSAAATTLVFLADEDVSTRIREADVTASVSTVAAHAQVRRQITDLARAFARARDSVSEGRDTTTAIFPDAELKVFLTASLRERARRRLGDLAARAEPATLAQVEREIAERDRKDTERAADPLVRAPDALFLDTTDLTLEQVLDRLAEEVERRRSPSDDKEPAS